MRKLALAIGILCALVASAIEIPKASARALGVTKGRAFSEGLVFINGKYLEPPYVVERWGNGIRINGQPVIAQVIDWTEFLKTQSGVKKTTTENPVAAVPEEPEEDDELDDIGDDDSDSSLDDLFDDDPKPKKPAKKPAKKKRAKRRPAKPTTTVSYTLDGDFVPNEASKALVARVNKMRTDIDSQLRNGGFFCFGDNYARVSGGSSLAQQLLMKLPEIERNSTSPASLAAAVRAAGIVYLTPHICADLHQNKLDYLKLQRRREKLLKDLELKKLLGQ